MSNWNYATVVPTVTWRSASTLPRELSLVSESNHFYVTSKPVVELASLRSKSDTASVKQLSFKGEEDIFTGKKTIMQSELFLGFNISDSKTDSLGIILGNGLKERFIIGYSSKSKQFYIDRRAAGNSAFSKAFAGISTAPYSAGSTLKLHLFIDAGSAELFVDDGRLVMTSIVFPTEKFNTIKLFSKGGEGVLSKALYYGLDRIWPATNN
jgi:fructan beta-fructosidase